MRCLTLISMSALLLSACAVNHIVPYAWLLGDIIPVSEEQLPQYWTHSDISSDSLNGPGKMGCVRLKFIVDSRAGIWNPQVDALYGDQTVVDWAVSVLSGISFKAAETNKAKRPVATSLTLAYNHAPQDVDDWAACQKSVGIKSVDKTTASTDGSQSTSSPFVDACKKPGFQCVYQPITMLMSHQDGSPYEVVLPPPSVVIQGDYVNILAGQTVYIEADVDGDRLANLHLVQSVVHPEKTLIMSLEQVTMAGGHMMFFKIHNPFDRDLKYHAGIMPLDQPNGQENVFKTSTCPVMAKIMATESWPQPIFQIVVGKFHFPKQGSEEAGCVD